MRKMEIFVCVFPYPVCKPWLFVRDIKGYERDETPRHKCWEPPVLLVIVGGMGESFYNTFEVYEILEVFFKSCSDQGVTWSLQLGECQAVTAFPTFLQVSPVSWMLSPDLKRPVALGVWVHSETSYLRR